MTKQELAATKKALAETRERATESPEAARAYLRKLGMITPSGKLTKRYSRSAVA
ncbi:MAG: hypothetical protein Q7T08_14370 [Devosia sp.]|nr:hypothetical protein [Devosia sp.]